MMMDQTAREHRPPVGQNYGLLSFYIHSENTSIGELELSFALCNKGGPLRASPVALIDKVVFTEGARQYIYPGLMNFIYHSKANPGSDVDSIVDIGASDTDEALVSYIINIAHPFADGITSKPVNIEIYYSLDNCVVSGDYTPGQLSILAQHTRLRINPYRGKGKTKEKTPVRRVVHTHSIAPRRINPKELYRDPLFLDIPGPAKMYVSYRKSGASGYHRYHSLPVRFIGGYYQGGCPVLSRGKLPEEERDRIFNIYANCGKILSGEVATDDELGKIINPKGLPYYEIDFEDGLIGSVNRIYTIYNTTTDYTDTEIFCMVVFTEGDEIPEPAIDVDNIRHGEKTDIAPLIAEYDRQILEIEKKKYALLQSL